MDVPESGISPFVGLLIAVAFLVLMILVYYYLGDYLKEIARNLFRW